MSTPEFLAALRRTHNEPVLAPRRGEGVLLSGPCRCPICRPDLHDEEAR